LAKRSVCRLDKFIPKGTNALDWCLPIVTFRSREQG